MKNSWKLTTILMISLALFASANSASSDGTQSNGVYFCGTIGSYDITGSSMSVTVNDWYIDVADDNMNLQEGGYKVQLIVYPPSGGSTTYTVESCTSTDPMSDDAYPNREEPDLEDPANGDGFPNTGTADSNYASTVTNTYTESGINIPEGSDIAYNSKFWWDTGCSGSLVVNNYRNVASNVQFNDPPSASLSVNTTSIRAGEEVEFTYSGSDSDGSVSSMQIDYDDGSSSPTYSSDGTVDHEYSFSGSYNPTLTVTDNDGATATDSVTVDVDPNCNFYTGYYYPPREETAVLGEDMDVDFLIIHNDASNCPSASDIKFEVCGTNLTAPDHVEATTYTDYYGNTYDAFNASLTVQSDVTCNSQSNTVKFWNTQDEEKITESELNIIRGYTKGTPIHDNGDYKPQAEIIVATEMSHPRTDYYDLENENVANKSDTKFFVCRGSYRGSDIQDSKLVKVQEGTSGSYSWQYYRCAMNGTWREAQCEPGQEMVYDPRNQQAQCQMEATQTITATYFNIQDIPHSGKTNGYIAGFKIPESDIDIYNDLMGFDPQKVDAECWMGDDDQRPSSTSDSVVFTSTYDGSGDLWALAEIPPRSGVNKNTYSCVWGIKNAGSTADTNVYESTNTIPLKAKDGGRDDIQYDIIESRRLSADINTGTPRSVWSHYKSKADTSEGRDERSYISGTDEYMLDYEVPYCSTNSYWSSAAGVLDNIVCN